VQFISIDVETANANMASICQIGIAKFVNGVLVEEWVSVLDPEDYFDPINVSIHGIDAAAAQGKPTLLGVIDNLRYFLEGSVCVSHTHFDRVSIQRAFAKHQIPVFEMNWLDSAKVARRTWDEVAKKGYGLANLCERIGYKFKHHDALEDAKAAGHILLAALKESQLSIEDWTRKVVQPINPGGSFHERVSNLTGNPEGELAGEVIVFTGSLDIPRHEAAELAASVGCSVIENVTSKTTLLIVGDQDIARLAGKEKSSKHLKAEQLMSKGQQIRILQESDFRELVRLAQFAASQL
jgi:DNA polymerase-3 subunit epsilon